jgi:hypothetical protein
MKVYERTPFTNMIAQLDELIVIDWAKKKEEANTKRAVEEVWASIQLDRRVEEHYKQTEEDQAWVEHRGWAYKSL